MSRHLIGIRETHMVQGHAAVRRRQRAGFLHGRNLVHNREQSPRGGEGLGQARRQCAQCQRRTEGTGDQHHGGEQLTDPIHIGQPIPGQYQGQRPGERGGQHHHHPADAAESAVVQAQLDPLMPQFTRLLQNRAQTPFTCAEADDLVQAAHVVQHRVIQRGGVAANIRPQIPHAGREQARQRHADQQMHDNQQRHEPRVEERERHSERHRGHDGDDHRRDGVREEDLQQFHVGGDQGDQVALAAPVQFGRRQTTHGGERLRPEQREQLERHIVVHILLGIPHQSTDDGAHRHRRESNGHGHSPHRFLQRGEQGNHAEHRQEGGGQVAECAERAGGDHRGTQRTDLVQQAADQRAGAVGCVGLAGRNAGRRRGRFGLTAWMLQSRTGNGFRCGRPDNPNRTDFGRRDRRAGNGPVPDMLDDLLCAEQVGVHAATRHQRRVRAGFGHPTVVEHHHLVGGHGVRHAVRDHDHGGGLRQFADRVQDHGLALGVHAAGGLVEDIDRCVAQQRAGDGQALALPARQVRRIGGDRHVQSLGLFAHEVSDMGQFQRGPQFVVGGFGGGHQQVLTQRAGEQVTAGGDQGHRGGHRIGAQIAQFHGLQIDRT